MSVVIGDDRVRLSRAGRAPREIFYEELRAAEARPGILSRLILRRTDGGRAVARTPDPVAAARRIEEILAGFGAVETVEELRRAVEEADRRDGFFATRFVDDLLTAAVGLGASDLHLAPAADRVTIRIRIDGLLVDLGAIGPGRGRRVAARLKVLAGLKAHRTDLTQEGRISAGGSELRLSAVPAVGGERIVVRAYDRIKERITPDDLGLDPAQTSALRRAVRAPQGVVLLTGPSAGGKTTTAYALLRELAAERADRVSVATIEDPVECRLDRVDQIEVGGRSPAALLRAMLRQDLDVLMIGEVRSPETARVAFAAGASGHLVITTLHAGSAAEAIVRLFELEVEPYLIATGLTLVANQRLFRRRTGGREAIAEVMPVTDELRAALAARPPASELCALVPGTTLREVAERRCAAGAIDRDELERVLG